VTELAEQLRLFEPLLNELAAVFCPEASGPMELFVSPAADAYHRCKAKRSRIGKACASDHRAVLDHADEIMHAIAHDYCPSGNRQLIVPLTDVLGVRQTMQRILGYLEMGSAAERLGAARACYWAAPTLQYSTLDEFHEDRERRSDSGAVKVAVATGVATPKLKNAEAHLLLREFVPRFRIGCLRAFLASDNLSDRRYFSHHFSLVPEHYPVELNSEVEAARRIAEQHPELFGHGCLPG
jgi:hypothetical protein